MKLKKDESGHIVEQDGKPVYIKDDGTEVAFDVAGTVATISRLNGEAKGHREAKEAAEAKLKVYEGIEDPEAARKALQTVQSLDQKKLVDAGEVERLKAEIAKATEERYKPVVEENGKLKGMLHQEKIGGSFARSKFVTDRLAIPPDLVEARFGAHFGVDDKTGRVVAKDGSGNVVYSRSNPGEEAGFDEALEILVSQYPYKDNILKGANGSGSGSTGGAGGNGGGGKAMTRQQFDALGAAERASAMKEGVQLSD